MKTVRARRNYDWDTLMREVETLRKREHNNIVPLLASFTINAFGSEERSLRILFPWADVNMVQWLNLDSTPLEGRPQRDEQRNWLYHEIYALVSAISYLHRDIGGIITSHHDLKPENILWLDGSLKICDLGRSHLLALAEGSETEGRSGLGTFTYQPPEYYNDDGSRSSRKHGRAFDVWSLGCIIIEMAILIVHGWGGHKGDEFAKARETRRSRRRDFSEVRDPDDSFHNNMDVVGQWVSDLKQGESPMLVQTLSIAEKMLAENPDERLYSWEAELDLYEMLYPDKHSIARMEKAGVRVQPPRMRNIGHAQNPLHRAALSGNRDRVAKLLESGWPIDAQDGSGLTPMQLAKNGGHTLVEHLLASHRSHEAEYQPSLHEATQYISSLDLDLFSKDGFEKIRLDLAESGRIHEFKEILKETKCPDALLKCQDGNGLTLLHWAAKTGCFEVVAHIFNFEVAESLTWRGDNYGKTPLHHSSENGAQEIVHILLRRSSCPKNLVSLRDRSGRTPLHWAALGGHLNAVELLLDWEEFVDPCICEWSIHGMLDATDDSGNTPLQLAISNKQDAVVERLRKAVRDGV
jgi:ankyrin repeat protein